MSQQRLHLISALLNITGRKVSWGICLLSVPPELKLWVLSSTSRSLHGPRQQCVLLPPNSCKPVGGLQLTLDKDPWVFLCLQNPTWALPACLAHILSQPAIPHASPTGQFSGAQRRPQATPFPFPSSLFPPRGIKVAHCRQQCFLPSQSQLRRHSLSSPTFPQTLTKSKLWITRHTAPAWHGCQFLLSEVCLPPSMLDSHDMSWMVAVRRNLSPCLRRKSCRRKMKKAMQQRMVEKIMEA